MPFYADRILGTQLGQQRKRQETVSDRSAKWRLGRRLLVNMNKLMVFSAIGKRVDAILLNCHPVARGQLCSRHTDHVVRFNPMCRHV
jgi:hypothetical protein